MDELKLVLTEQVKTIMEERGIRETDLKEVLKSAEESGIFLHKENSNMHLAKKRIGNFTIYVEYEKSDGFTIKDTYGHRVLVQGDLDQ